MQRRKKPTEEEKPVLYTLIKKRSWCKVVLFSDHTKVQAQGSFEFCTEWIEKNG